MSKPARQTDDSEWQRLNGQEALYTQRGAAQQAQGAVNPAAAARGIREESLSSRPKVGSTELQRAGLDPNYHVNPDGPSGVVSNAQNAAGFTPQAQWDKVFHAPAAPIVPPVNPAVAAPPASALGSNPVVSGTQPVAVSHPSPAPWTGPSTAPRLGPPRAEPWSPHAPGVAFNVPAPLTGPQGNASSDAENLAANKAMAQPGGANFWSPSSPTPASAEFQPSQNVAALNSITGSGAVGHTPYGTIQSIPPEWSTTASQPDWSSLRDTSPAESVPNGTNPTYSLPLSSADTVGPSSTPGPSATPGPSSGAKPKFAQQATPNPNAAPQMQAYS